MKRIWIDTTTGTWGDIEGLRILEMQEVELDILGESADSAIIDVGLRNGNEVTSHLSVYRDVDWDNRDIETTELILPTGQRLTITLKDCFDLIQNMVDNAGRPK